MKQSNVNEFKAGKCPCCLRKRMRLFIEKRGLHSYGTFKCANCESETKPAKIPVSAIKSLTATNDIYIGMMLNHWASLEKQFNVRYPTEPSNKLLILSNYGLIEENIKSCPICRSTHVRVIYDACNMSIVCKQCGFHTKEFPVSEDIRHKTSMMNIWNANL